MVYTHTHVYVYVYVYVYIYVYILPSGVLQGRLPAGGRGLGPLHGPLLEAEERRRPPLRVALDPSQALPMLGKPGLLLCVACLYSCYGDLIIISPTILSKKHLHFKHTTLNFSPLARQLFKTTKVKGCFSYEIIVGGNIVKSPYEYSCYVIFGLLLFGLFVILTCCHY